MRKSGIDAYATLRRRIILGEFLPGTQLKEESLAAELSVSRSPIRVAFRRLADDGLVHAEPNRGVFVASWADQDNDEVFDLRALVESHAAGLAAQRKQPEHLQQLQALNQRMATLIADKPEDFLDELQQANRQFHQVVLQAAASPRLLAFVQSLLAVQRVLGAFYYYTDAQLAESLQDHCNITRAIERGDAPLAQAMVNAHIRGTSQRLREQRQELRADAPGTAGVLGKG
jgi:DNA-binding GntR family transcriptional regulator